MTDNNKIKMVALDLDGTTLNSDKEISQRTLKAFKVTMEKGVHIVISTGRTFNSLPKQLFEVKGLEYVITSNGAQITYLPSMKKVYENYITEHAVEEVVRVLKSYKLSAETFVEGKAYIDKNEFDDFRENGSSFRDVEYVLTTRNPIEDIHDYMIKNKNKIENISINFENLEDKNRIAEVLNEVDNITVTSSFEHNFEIGGANTSKGEALTFLMRKLGIKKEELMACGDSQNDSQMLKLAGIGVAVANADDQVKEIADYITDNHNNDGVAKAIEKFV